MTQAGGSLENLDKRGMGQLISTQQPYAHGAEIVALVPVSTANAVGDIAARLLHTVCKSA